MCVTIVFVAFLFWFKNIKLQRSKKMGSNKYGNIDLCLWNRQANAFYPVLQYDDRNFVILSKYLKHFSIFKMTCFNKETMTSISNTTSKLCLINPGMYVWWGSGDYSILL